MKLEWHRAAPTRPVASALLAAPRLATPDACAVGERADLAAQLLGAGLPWELRLLCQGLVNCSWSDTLRAVSTDVGLPADRKHELVLRALCWELAEEFGLEQTVRRQDQIWIARFSRHETGMAATAEEGERSGYRADTPIPGGVARPDKAAWGLSGPRLRGRAYMA